MDNNEMTKNRAALNKCSRAYNSISGFYVIGCVSYAGIAMYLTLVTCVVNGTYLFLDGPFFKGAVLAAGFLGTYRKNNILALLAPLIMFINTAAFWNADNLFDIFWGSVIQIKINALFLIASVILAAATVIANSKYHYLEQQPGFPQFSAIFEQQKTGRPEYGMTYEERAEELKKTARSEMDEL